MTFSNNFNYRNVISTFRLMVNITHNKLIIVNLRSLANMCKYIMSNINNEYSNYLNPSSNSLILT